MDRHKRSMKMLSSEPLNNNFSCWDIVDSPSGLVVLACYGWLDARICGILRFQTDSSLKHRLAR